MPHTCRMKTIKCKHYKGDGFTYVIDKDTELSVCTTCGYKLRQAILEQLVLEAEFDINVSMSP